jgi:hypothetical protein
MSRSAEKLPPFTVLIEWENAIDVEDEWTARAMVAFQAELERCQDLLSERPKVMYLYNQNAVQEDTILNVIDRVAPKLRELADVELVPTPGLTYYQLKNFGAQRAQTDIVVMLDSDAGPQPGWLAGLLKPFADNETMAVGGFTVLGYEDLLSKTMALIWIFNLASEREITVQRKKIHANNCAMRTAFFRANPFPDLPAFKKQCGIWLRDIDRRGVRWTRTADAMTVHAPHPGFKFLTWRAWTAGMDRDFQAYYSGTRSRLRRVGYAFRMWAKKSWRATRRIFTKHAEVDLPAWQIPAALLIAYGFYTVWLVGELWSALSRSFAPPTHFHQATQQ